MREAGRTHSIYMNNLYASFVESSIIASFLSTSIVFIYSFLALAFCPRPSVLRCLLMLFVCVTPVPISILAKRKHTSNLACTPIESGRERRARNTIYWNSTISSNTINDWQAAPCRTSASGTWCCRAAFIPKNHGELYARPRRRVFRTLSPIGFRKRESIGPFALQ